MTYAWTNLYMRGRLHNLPDCVKPVQGILALFVCLIPIMH